MPSDSLKRWGTKRATALDQIASAHALVGGTERGRRYATEQLNHAYATLLASQFQGFCRDLHSECIVPIVATARPELQRMIRMQFLWNRALDRSNPTPATLGSDFGRFGFAFWPAINADDPRNDRRRAILEELILWRNAIAHQDFDSARLGCRKSLHLAQVRSWRRSLNLLAASFDRVMQANLESLLGVSPW